MEDEGHRTLITTNAIGAQRESDRPRRILFIIEPIIAGVILLPIIPPSWHCG